MDFHWLRGKCVSGVETHAITRELTMCVNSVNDTSTSFRLHVPCLTLVLGGSESLREFF